MKNLLGLRYRLIPTSLDAWLILSILFWWLTSIASVGSVLLESSLCIPMLGMGAISIAIISNCLFVTKPQLEGRFAFVTIAMAWICWHFASTWLDGEPNEKFYDDLAKDSRFYEWTETIVEELNFASSVLLLFAALILSLIRFVWQRFCSSDKDQHFTSPILDLGIKLFDQIVHYRQRLLIGFLLITLPGTVLRNAIGPGSSVEKTLLYFILGSAAILVVAVFCRVVRIFYEYRWIQILIKFAIWIAGLGSYGYYVFQRWLDPPFGSERFLAFGVTFSVPIGIAWWWLSKSPLLRRRYLSAYTLPIIFLFLCPYFEARRKYDATAFADQLFGRNEFDLTRWLEWAAKSRAIRVQSGGALWVSDDYGWGEIILSVDNTKSEQSLGLLSKYGIKDRGDLRIYQITPNTNLDPIKNLSCWDRLATDGRMSIEQFHQFCAKDGRVFLSGINFERPPKDKQANLEPHRENLGTVIFISSDDSIENFSAALESFEGAFFQSIALKAPLTLQDFHAVAKLSNTTWIQLNNSSIVPDRAFNTDGFDNALQGVTIYNATLDDLPVDWIVKTKVSASIRQLPKDADFWQWAFSMPNCNLESASLELSFGGSDRFAEIAERNHWIYGRDDNLEITHLWLPRPNLLIGIEADLKNLRVLRFDRYGLIGIENGSYSPVFKRDLVRLPKLERLYLPDNMGLNDLDWLSKNFPRLRHIQMSLNDDALRDWKRPHQFQSLESICVTLSNNVYDIALAQLFANLPSLKKLVIVEYESRSLSESELEPMRKDFRSALKGVDVQWIPWGVLETELSSEFNRHRQRLQKKLLEEVSLGRNSN